MNLTILLTYDCNLRCVYCYEGAGEQNKGSLSTETREAIFEFIKNKWNKENQKYYQLFYLEVNHC